MTTRHPAHRRAPTALLALALLLAPVAAPPVAAQESPPAGLEALQTRIGSWDVTLEEWGSNGWVEGETSRTEIVSLLNGRGQEERLDVRGAQNRYNLHILWSWDAFQEIYRQVTLDDGVGVLDVYEGDFVDGRLVLTNLESETFYRLADGNEMAFRLSYDLAEPEVQVMDVDLQIVGTGEWQPMLRLTYRRVR